MRIVTFLATLSVLLCAAALPASAQTVTNAGGIAFGKIVAISSTSTVTINPDSVRSALGAILINGGNPQAATFNVTGEPGANYRVLFGTSTALTGPGSNMDLSDFITSLTNNAGVIGINGTASFTVGATLVVGATQTPGAYVNGNIPVTVEYYTP